VTGLPTQPLRLAVAQARALPGDVAENARRAASLASHAARRDARVVLLPELHLCGYDLPGVPGATVNADDAGAVDDVRLLPLSDIAGEHDLTVLVGACVREPGGALTNALLVVDAAGTRRVYTKQHLWHDEATVFARGSTGGQVTVDGWRLGLGICYDLSFPEHARAAALDGAHAYLVAGAFAAGSEHRAAVYLPARALENTMFTAFANPVGGPPDRPCAGGSGVWTPDGRTAGVVRDRLLRYDLDPTGLRRVRGYLPMLAELATP
jgi:predicted amidohydrolase